MPLWAAGNDFNTLLASFVSLLALKKHSNLSKLEVAEYILTKSEGIIGEIATIIRHAAILAIKTKRELIDLKILESIDYYSPSERRQMFERELI